MPGYSKGVLARAVVVAAAAASVLYGFVRALRKQTRAVERVSFVQSIRTQYSLVGTEKAVMGGFRLVLVGGGHSNVQLVKQIARNELPAHVELVMVSDCDLSYYSGMVPGHVAGQYSTRELAIDCRALCRAQGWEFVRGQVDGIDADRKELSLLSGEVVSFDLALIDVGSTSRVGAVEGAAEYGISTRPIANMMARMVSVEEAFRKVLVASARASGADDKGNEGDEAMRLGQSFDVVVIGGGHAGIELTMCLRSRLDRILVEEGGQSSDVIIRCTIIDSSPVLLPKAAPTRESLQRYFDRHGIRVLGGRRVECVRALDVALTDGASVPYDAVLLATGACSHSFVKERTNLQVDEHGYILVDDFLRSVSHPCVYAVGDCSAMASQPPGFPPKAGVYAVRQGALLAKNVRSLLFGGDMHAYHPQHSFLSLLNCGDGTAIGSKYGISFEGRWVFWLKDWIDRTFMQIYQVGGDDDEKRAQADVLVTVPEMDPLPAKEAAMCLLQSGDEDFGAQWCTLKHMNANAGYAADVRRIFTAQQRHATL